MSGLDAELAGLEARLVTEPWNRDVIERRIRDTKTAIKAAESARPAPAPIEEPVAYEVETATLPKANRPAKRA